MRARLLTNINEVIGQNRARSAALPRMHREAANEIALVMQRTSVEILKKRIYSVMIPTSRTGRPKWKRTYDLLARERWYPDGANIIGTNDSAHAAFRDALGTDRGRPIRSPGVQVVHWQQEAVEQRHGFILQARVAAQRRAMRAR